MPLLTRRRIFRTAVAVCVLSLTGFLFYLFNRERLYDPKFDTRVAEPAYRKDRPQVLYDEAHRNTHTMDGAYKPFADLIRNDGYDVRPLREQITGDGLSRIRVLVIVCARGSNDANDAAAFTVEEAAVIDQWVRSGGSLLLVTDHWPYGSAA